MKSIFNLYISSLFIFSSSFVFSTPVKVNPYYGKNISNYLKASKPSIQKLFVKDLKKTLNLVLSGGHISQKNKPDVIVSSCENANTSICTEHTVLGYKKAREILFGDIHLQFNRTIDEPEHPELGVEYFIKDIYCLKNFTNADITTSALIGPNLIPEHTVLNTEHVWPQSRFKNNEEKETGPMYEMKKSDLHILYPSDEDTNALRSNYEFADVLVTYKNSKCSEAKLGYISENDKTKMYFEPPKESKGNIARAIFYFSVRYNVPVNGVEESYLRKWHEEDPIDFMETIRNEQIYKYEHVRNPFIDHPQLVNKILDF